MVPLTHIGMQDSWFVRASDWKQPSHPWVGEGLVNRRVFRSCQWMGSSSVEQCGAASLTRSWVRNASCRVTHPAQPHSYSLITSKHQQHLEVQMYMWKQCGEVTTQIRGVIFLRREGEKCNLWAIPRRLPLYLYWDPWRPRRSRRKRRNTLEFNRAEQGICGHFLYYSLHFSLCLKYSIF